MPSHELVIDDHLLAATRMGPIGDVLSGENASIQQGDLQGVEVSGVGSANEGVEQVSGTLRRMLGNGEDVMFDLSRPGHRFAEPHGADARHRGHAVQQPLVKGGDLLRRVVRLCRQGVRHGQDVVRRTAKSGRAQPEEVFQQESGGDQQHHRHPNLHGEQSLADGCAGGAPSDRPG